MTATRYLVEGDRLDVLIGQVKRMGRRVTVLKAEKVRKGGLAGMFAKEHYEILVEVEGVGEPPESFRNATLEQGKAAMPTASSSTRKTHQTLSELADEAGVYRKKKSADEPRTGGADTGEAGVVSSDVPVSGETEKKDTGLQTLLDEARSQLNSNTEAAAAQLENQLAEMGLSKDSAAQTAPVPVSNQAAVKQSVNALSRPVSSVLDARLQGGVAPGASASAARQPVPVVDEGVKISVQAADQLGFPSELVGRLSSGEADFSLQRLVEALPAAAEPLERGGAVIVVVGSSPIALSVVETAQRLAGRVGSNAYCVLGGPKTTLPGEAPRARSAEELRKIMDEHPNQTCVLALADSLIEVHRRTMAKLLSVVYVDQTWAVVDGRQSVDTIHDWLKGLPDAVRPDALAVQRIWEAPQPGALLELGVPIGMLDGVPARGEAWKLLLEDLLN